MDGILLETNTKKKKKDATQQRSENLTRNKHARENVFYTRCMMYDRCTLDILFSIYIQYIYIYRDINFLDQIVNRSALFAIFTIR